MARARRTRSPWWILLFIVFVGGVLGSVVAEALSAYPSLGFLTREVRLALADPPFTVDLRLLTVTFGLTIRLNLAMVGGVFLAVWLFRLMV